MTFVAEDCRAPRFNRDAWIVPESTPHQDHRPHGVDASELHLQSIKTIETLTRGRFERLVRQWKSDLAVESSATRITSHPAYLEVMKMGKRVVPLILADISTHGTRHWGWALQCLTGVNPVSSEDIGRLARQNMHWLAWGRSQGLL